MTTLIHHKGAIAAVATARRVVFTRELADADRRVVLAKARFAADVDAGELPGPYTDEAATAYALEFLDVDVERVTPAAPTTPRHEEGRAMSTRRYGPGNGTTTFNIPDLRGAGPIAAVEHGDRRRQPAAGPLPKGYVLVNVPPATADARRRRPVTEWRASLEYLASTQAGREGAWQSGSHRLGRDALSLAARGAVLIARHRSQPNIYSITPTGLRALGLEAAR